MSKKLGLPASSKRTWSDRPEEARIISLNFSGTPVAVTFRPDQTELEFKNILAQAMLLERLIDPAELSLIQEIDVDCTADYLRFDDPRSLLDVINSGFVNLEHRYPQLNAYLNDRNLVKLRRRKYVSHYNSRSDVNGTVRGLEGSFNVNFKVRASLRQGIDLMIDLLLDHCQIDYAQFRRLKQMSPSRFDELFSISYVQEALSFTEFHESFALGREYNFARLFLYYSGESVDEYKSPESNLHEKIDKKRYKNRSNESLKSFYVSMMTELDRVRFGQLTHKSSQGLRLIMRGLLDNLDKIKSDHATLMGDPLFVEFKKLMLGNVEKVMEVSRREDCRAYQFKISRMIAIKLLSERCRFFGPGLMRVFVEEFLGPVSSDYQDPFYIDQVRVKLHVNGGVITVSHRTGRTPEYLGIDLADTLTGVYKTDLTNKPGFQDAYAEIVRQREDSPDLELKVVNLEELVKDLEVQSSEGVATKTGLFSRKPLLKAPKDALRVSLTQEIDLLVSDYETRKKEGTEDVKIRFLKSLKYSLGKESCLLSAASVCRQIDSAFIPSKMKVFSLGEELFSEVEAKQALHGKQCSHIYKYFRKLCFQVVKSSQSQSNGGGSVRAPGS